VSAFPLDDELVLYEPAAGLTYVLNPTAAFIWSRCDGSRTLEQLASEVTGAYGVDAARALSDVAQLLEQLESSGFLAAVD
jgi:PqqD family protein of HPr-rel-A system